MWWDNGHKILFEFLGTMFLSFVIFATRDYLAIGAALAVCCAVFAGGSFNPAVTLALVYDGGISRDDFIPYVVAEIAGGIMGYELVRSFR